MSKFSILYPDCSNIRTTKLSAAVCHDLGLDNIVRKITEDVKEQQLITKTLASMTSDSATARYRQKVFADLLRQPELRKQLTKLFERVEFLREYGIMHIESDDKLGLWHLMHRLEELNDYIKCVEEMKDCLGKADLTSEGLIAFRAHIDELYNDACFAELKKDIAAMKAETSDIQSVTVGINVNERFEAVSMGLISVNDKPFKKSNMFTNFADALLSKNKIQKGTDWKKGDMHYQLIEQRSDSNFFAFMERAAAVMADSKAPMDAKTKSTLVTVPDGDGINNTTFHLENVINKMLDVLVRRLRDTLTKYASVAVVDISRLIPEFVYYIRMSEFIEDCISKGFPFCEAAVCEESGVSMNVKGFYNLKLAVNIPDQSEIVYNDLVFDKEHTIYILTGANRGGKTTATQAVGLLFVLAQGGIYVPASEFSFRPADCIYTHFPADEDKTMDLGRLGEECIRFKEIYNSCTSESLLLMNETFSTTSFEEGYYIARDSVRALVNKRVRTIYNTHMHKLAEDAPVLCSEEVGVSSLIVKNEGAKRSFKIEVAPPEGMSYAMDIAEKYGVTYDMLVNEQ
ncbi:MAG: DNA mismatch repair protein [Oscillospiraceae bacterium]